jgi:hypothetical protein
MPVAVQADGDVQDTLANWLGAAPAGLGVGWMRHRVPSQCSDKVRRTPDRLAEYPAAVQAEDAVQSTPIRKFSPPARLGVGWIAHRVPFHRSARVWTVPALLTKAPVAVQVDADGHATVFKKANCAPAGLGAGWMAHRAPFHRSASVPAFEAPTAVQDEADVHATPLRLPPPCGGLGVGWMRQLVPSHRSARVLALGVKALEAPTAVHADADGHATPDRKPAPCGGLGVGWMRQAVPSHRSASVPAFELPTAVQDEADVHATPLRKPPPWDGLGVGWMRQAVPSHRSARGWEAPARPALFPTAVHADDPVQETPNRELTTAPRGLGVGSMRHVLPSQCSARVTVIPEALTYVPTAMHEEAAVQDSQNSWPVGTLGFGLGVIDQPAPEAPAGAARAPTRSTAATSKRDLFIAIHSPAQAHNAGTQNLAP